MIRGLFIAIVVLFVAGCGGSGDYARTDSSDAERETEHLDWAKLPVIGVTFRTPFEVLLSQGLAEESVVNNFMGSCMAQEGFPLLSPGNDVEAVIITNMVRASDLDEATRRGLNRAASREYSREQDERVRRGPPPTTDPTQPVIANQAQLDVAAVAQDACVKNAPGRSPTAVKIGFDSYQAHVLGDPTMVRARQSWAVCMEKAGYKVRTVRELVELESISGPRDLSLQMGKMSPAELKKADDSYFRLEVDAAKAQVGCDVDAYGPVFDEWVRLEDLWLEEHGEDYRGLDLLIRLTFATFIEL